MILLLCPSPLPHTRAALWAGAWGCVSEIIPQELALRVPLAIILGTGPGSPPGHQSLSVLLPWGGGDVTLSPKQSFHGPLVPRWKSICALQNIFHGHSGLSELGEWPGAASLLVPGSTKGTEMGQSHPSTRVGNSSGFPWSGIPMAGISSGLSKSHGTGWV